MTTTPETIQDLVKDIIKIDALSKEMRFKKDRFRVRNQASELRRQVASLMDSDHIFVLGWHILRQHHERYTTVAFYTPSSWENYQEYQTRRSELDWIK